MKLCECGCGTPTRLAQANSSSRGFVKGEPFRFIAGHQRRNQKWPDGQREKVSAKLLGHPVTEETRNKIASSMKRIGHKPPAWAAAKGNANRGLGSSHPSWKGGIIYANGRKCIYAPDHPRAHANGYVYESILLAGKKEGRIIEPFEVVHHLDGDETNNDPTNLQVLPSQSEHMKLHREQGDIF